VLSDAYKLYFFRGDVKMKTVKKGDRVVWNSDVGHVRGKVVKKLTKNTSIKKHKVRASKENPQYLVKSDKTDKLATHKPGALKKNSKKKSLKKKDYSVLKDNY
jgi:hypothetical protein